MVPFSMAATGKAPAAPAAPDALKASRPATTWKFLSTWTPRATRCRRRAVPLPNWVEVAWLEVVDVNDLGAFVDWGLPKDLFIPFAEQQHTLSKGGYTLVRSLSGQPGTAGGFNTD